MKMVISYDFPFSEIFDETSKTAVLSLPTYKGHGLIMDFDTSKIVEPVYKDKPPPLPFARSDIFNAEISRWRRLTASDERCKAVYEVTFDVEGSNFAFKAGDTIGILPQNRQEEVNTVLKHLSITSQADLVFYLRLDSTIKGAKTPVHIPVESTITHVLTHCVELRSVLKKLFILALSRYTKCDTERRALEFLCSKEGSASYTKHILSKGICILDIFATFKTCKPPIEVLLANLPRLLPRPYSIINSGLKDSNILKICFSVTDSGDRKGITTTWLEESILKDPLEKIMENLNLESIIREKLQVPMYLRSNMSQFSLPPNNKTHLLMIATGTGVAPFMGFLEERQMQNTGQSEMGEAWLFFGCRDPELDFLYQTELGEYEDSRVLKKLITAFSRVKSADARRVQESLCSNGHDIARLINEGASVFVCGEAKTMVTQVRECIVSNLVEHGGKSQEEAEKIIAGMEKERRYVVDLWS